MTVYSFPTVPSSIDGDTINAPVRLRRAGRPCTRVLIRRTLVNVMVAPTVPGVDRARVSGVVGRPSDHQRSAA